ncbi:MAG: amino acid ABC transporter permease [Actinomycetota bacterium]
MSAFASTRTGAEEDPRLPSAHLEEPPRAVALLLASWVILLQGSLILIFLPVLVFTSKDVIPPRNILSFGVAGVVALVGGGLVYAPRRWTWWTALASTVACAAYLLMVGGLASAREGYFAAALTGIAVVLLLLGYPAAGNTEALSLASARIPFRIKVTAVWIAIFFMLGLFLTLSDLDTSFMRDVAWYITKGLEWTIVLSVCAIVFATILAVFGALGRLSRNPVAYGVSGFYTSFFRGTPLIVQLFLIYLALPEIGSNLDRTSLTEFLSLTVFVAGVIGLGLNYGAYMTEIFRAGIQSVGHGQAEAADALGMTYTQRMRRVVLPQAIRVIIPPTGNEFIAMMKDTALVSFLGVQITRTELFGRAQLAFSANLTKRLETLLIAAALYWLLTSIFTFFQSRLERRISKGYVRTVVQTGMGGKRVQFLPVGGGGPGGGAGVAVIEMPVDDEPRP